MLAGTVLSSCRNVGAVMPPGGPPLALCGQASADCTHIKRISSLWPCRVGVSLSHDCTKQQLAGWPTHVETLPVLADVAVFLCSMSRALTSVAMPAANNCKPGAEVACSKLF